MPVPWTFAAFRDTAPPGTQILPVNPKTIVPAIILWALVTMNTASQYEQNGAGSVTEQEKNDIAAALGCTRSTVDGFFALAANPANRAAFVTTAKLFEAISHPHATLTAAGLAVPAAAGGGDDYDGIGCPANAAPMLLMANLWAASAR